MCGIVGYTGNRNAAEIVLSGLNRLEYRGYDSAGLALQNGAGLMVQKVSGTVSRLQELFELEPASGHCAIGHTRWATHGAPTQVNAHPHTACTSQIALVHNGVIENAGALRALLETRGHRFVSETDTEVLAHLVEESEGETLEERVMEALRHVDGTYGLAVVWEMEPTKIVVARNGSPVILGIGDSEFFFASDAAAVIEHTRSIVHLEDGDLVVLTPDSYRVVDCNAEVQERTVDHIGWSLDEVNLDGHPNHMHKEIVEQPEATRRALSGRLRSEVDLVRLGGLRLSDEEIRDVQRIVMVACGTSWHAALIARYAIEQLAGIPVTVEYASEFRYLPHSDLSGSITIAVSQSGETADTLEAARAATAAGSRVIGVVNVVGSTLARESSSGIYLRAGPEIGVASTKAFTSQVAILLLLALYLGKVRGLRRAEISKLSRALESAPDLIRRTLEVEPAIQELAAEFHEARNFLYLGRGVSFPVALEGALKLKEISYIHAEGYPAAEMKHGPIALIDREMPVVCVAPSEALFPKMLANAEEVRARGGRIISICTNGEHGLDHLSECVIRVPSTPKLISPLVTVVPLQLLAYHIALLRGCDVDRPRNLAKSVTVE